MKKEISFSERIEQGEFWTTRAAAEFLGYSNSYIRKLCQQKKIAHIERGSQYFLRPDVVRGMVKEVEAITK